MTNTLLVLLAGASCTGKSKLAGEFHRIHEADVIRAWELVAAATGAVATRLELQTSGARLELETQGGWLADAVRRCLRTSAAPIVVVDSVQTPNQAVLIRQLSTASRLVYLTADRTERDRRFRARDGQGYVDAPSLEAVEANTAEHHAGILEAMADCVVDTTHLSCIDVYQIAVACFDKPAPHSLSAKRC